MKRLYFLVPSLKLSSTIVTELAEAGVGSEHIHIVGRDRTAIEEAHLNQATILHTTDILHAAKKGALVGAILGLLAGVTMVTFPPAGIALEGAAVVGMSAFGAAFGAWVSTMVGVSISDKVIEKYQKSILDGKLLMLVDIPRQRDTEIQGLIKEHHPNARVSGTLLNIKK